MKKIFLSIIILSVLFVGFRYWQVKGLEHNFIKYIAPIYQSCEIINRSFDWKTLNFEFTVEYIHKGIPFSGQSVYNPSIFQENWEQWAE